MNRKLKEWWKLLVIKEITSVSVGVGERCSEDRFSAKQIGNNLKRLQK